jgi:hypothetical protein
MFFSRFFRRMGEFYSKIEQWARTSEPAVGADVPEVVYKDMFEYAERQKALCKEGQVIFAIDNVKGFRSDPPTLISCTPFGVFEHELRRRESNGQWDLARTHAQSGRFLSAADSRAIDEGITRFLITAIVNE